MPGRRQPAGRPPSLQTYLLVGAGLAIFGEEVPMSSPLQQVVILGALAAALGGLVAALAYLVADWRHEHPHLH